MKNNKIIKLLYNFRKKNIIYKSIIKINQIKALNQSINKLSMIYIIIKKQKLNKNRNYRLNIG